MLTVEQLKTYNDNSNFRVIVKESPALAGSFERMPATMFVARKLYGSLSWCIYGMTMSHLKRICGDSFTQMVNTVAEAGTKLTIEQHIFDVIPHDAEVFKLYYY